VFGYKSSKDRLIDFLQAELERQRGYVAEVQQAALADHAIVVDAVSLCNEMIRYVPDNKAKSETLDEKTQRPRSMSTYLQELTDRSRKRALAGNNLVAKMQPPAGVKIAAS
jgi:hypothetical protein